MHGWAHRRGQGAGLDVVALEGARLGLAHGVEDGLRVLDDLRRRERAFADADADVGGLGPS